MFKKCLILLFIVSNIIYAQELYIGIAHNGAEIYLTQQERDYLTKLNSIHLLVDEKYNAGIVSDYINLISNRLKIPITLQQTNNYMKSEENLNNKLCYISSANSPSKKEIDEFFTEVPFLELPLLSIFIHKDFSVLVTIFNKAINTISNKEKLEISEKWILMSPNNPKGYSILTIFIVAVLGLMALFIFNIFTVKKYKKILKEKKAELKNLTRTDYLTGVMNKKAINSIIENDIHRNLRSGLTSCLLLFDIDNFNIINNQYGHNIGDEIIIEICNKVKSIIRKVDFIARYNGGTFLILASGTSLYNASHLGEKIRNTVENIIFDNGVKTTISVGLAEFTNNENIEDWYKRVNGALLRAKKTGRNCVAMDNLLNESDLSIKNPFAQFIWRPEYSSNNPKIDKEHKELFKRISLLSEKLIFRKDKYKLIKELESFIQDSIAHFRDEEDILADKEYPDLESHKKEHKKLIDRAFKLVELYRNDDVNVTEILSFFYFDLIAKHIFEVDTKYFKYMK